MEQVSGFYFPPSETTSAPIPYEEYKGMKTLELAAEVKKRIENAIAEFSWKSGWQTQYK